jgi:hypothetical protein
VVADVNRAEAARAVFLELFCFGADLELHSVISSLAASPRSSGGCVFQGHLRTETRWKCVGKELANSKLGWVYLCPCRSVSHSTVCRSYHKRGM